MIINKLFRIGKKIIFKNKKELTAADFTTEEEFYTYFFTKHPKWSNSEPNKAEQARLNEIDKLVQMILNSIDKIDIIDFGCGRGWLTNKISKYGSIIGIEPVTKVVKFARKLYPELIFEVGSIEKLENKNVDLLIASEVIEHFGDENKLKYFKAFSNAIKMNGYCIITTPRAEVQNDWLSYRSNKGQPIENWLTEKQVECLAIESGFETVEKIILKEYANSTNSPLLELYQIWLFKKIK